MIPHRKLGKLCHPQLCTEALACCFSFCLLALFLAGEVHAGSFFKLHPQKAHGSLIKNREKPVTLDFLGRARRRDEVRHGRLLASPSAPVNFPLAGIADPSLAGLYFTEISIGTPSNKYYVQLDTGSDLLWVNCASCTTCPTSTQLGVPLVLYDPGLSSTSSNVLCGDSFCNIASPGGCQTADGCGYQLGYGDGSSSQGYFVRDSLQLQLVSRSNSITENVTVAFGCGTSQGGELQNSDQALDGIIGFGQSNLSFMSQLVNQNKIPSVFAHCLNGEGEGGGILVIGEVQSSALVYTAILQNQPHYNVNLKSISVNGETIPVDSSLSQNGGTIIDSGTTLAYFSDSVYQPLLRAIINAVQLDSSVNSWEGMACIPYVSSVDDAFPSVTLNFDGKGAVMVIKPHQYLIQAEGKPGNGWCIGFLTAGSNNLNLNILGDLVLKDQLIVYDLTQERIGWTDYDCSTNVSVLSTTGQTELVLPMAIPTSSPASSNVCHREMFGFTFLLFYLLLYCIL